MFKESLSENMLAKNKVYDEMGDQDLTFKQKDQLVNVIDRVI